ncbi:adenylate/guanylate cyclase domain-containing protein [Lutimaribacter marinistellae]|uniref:Adenylate/guanylate cyclase domain-containing protein n=1 Tax=Lutimaribacter marinistellae TaxID=1820329 RepID=A0ABV7TFA2_9RHOB
MLYAFLHFLNIGLGLLSPGWMEEMQDARQIFTRSAVGTTLLYSALVLHGGLALVRLGRRRSLRMSATEAWQTVLGLLIPLQLITHVVFTRYSHAVYDTNDEMSYVILIMWSSVAVWMQVALLLVVWIHGCIGLHLWLRLTRWWPRVVPTAIGLAVFVPGFALAGLMVEGRRIYSDFQTETYQASLMERFNWPSAEAFGALFATKDQGLLMFAALLGLTFASFGVRRVLRRRRSVRIQYADGPVITAERGLTLLEMSRAKGVPHTALCGGKGRCTTCRVVVEEGAEHLAEPGPTEARSLKAVKAPPGTRLACQIRPEAPTTVYRVFRPDGARKRAHASQGQERELAILFLDMRGFTARTTGQLPYDVVFLLNRFFDAIVPAITGAGGTVDKYLGDGLLAVFDRPDAALSAQQGLAAAVAVGHALNRFNASLADQGDPEIRIGMGLHMGNVVLGEIGAAGHAPRTIIGDTVNATSRLEGETKELGVELLVSHRVLEVGGADYDPKDLHPFDLRGVSQKLMALPLSRATDLEKRSAQNLVQQEQSEPADTAAET